MNLDHAIAYAQRGWAVIPSHSVTTSGGCSCGQALDFQSLPRHQTGKHPYPEHGHKEASKDPKQLMLWWTRWPRANISIVTGFISKLIVLDIDVKNQGQHFLALLEKKCGALPATVKAFSGGGGSHYYFQHPGFEVRGRIGMYPGMDVMADGGKIVAPPSNHKSGALYSWAPGQGPGEIEVAQIPRWLLCEVRTKREAPWWAKKKR